MPLRDGPGVSDFVLLLDRCCQRNTPFGARVWQLIAFHALPDFMPQWRASYDRGELPPGSDGSPVVTGFCVLDPGKRRVSIGLRAAFKGMVEGLAALALAITATVWPERRRRPGVHVALIGTSSADVFRDGSDARFVDFCRCGPLPILYAPTPLVVQCACDNPSDCDPEILYARRPLMRLLRVSPARAKDRLHLTLSLAGVVFRTAVRASIDRRQALLLRDNVESEVVRALVSWGSLGQVVLSSSAMWRQALYIRERVVPTAMVWYSENNKWIWDGENRPHNHPAFFCMDVQSHWVWTESQRKWLLSIGCQSDIHVVGPILWYLPAKSMSCSGDGPAWVTVFDIIPVSTRRLSELALTDPYYSLDRCVGFVRGVAEAARVARAFSGLDIRIRLKHKRMQLDADVFYGKLISELVQQQQLSLIDMSEDLYVLTTSSILSVVQPFSSPAIVAVSRSSRACYFDVDGTLRKPALLDPRIDFVQDVQALAQCIIRASKGRQ